MDQDDEENQVSSSRSHPSGSTLLPGPIANVVSLVTRSSSLYLQLGTFIGGLAIDGARYTTLTGLEVSRAVLESILYRAGKDISTRSTGDLGREEAEGLLEKSISALHKTITSISFAASTGFYISAAALESATDLSKQLLATLDSILGSTDSSRAIASIITLIRREFQNPATGQEGEQVSVADLLLGICSLALLQRWCRKITDSEIMDRKCEEIMWDVVVLDNGKRADVVDERPNSQSGLPKRRSLSFMTTGGNDVIETIEREGRAEEDSDEDISEISLKQRIMRSLPSHASVSITTSTTTTKTITVEVTGAQPPDLSPPAGVEIIEENAYPSSVVDLHGEVVTNDQAMGVVPRYRVVYRIIRNKLRGTNIESNGTVSNTDEAFARHEEIKDAPDPPKIQASPGFITSPGLSDTEEPPVLPARPTRLTNTASRSSNLPTPRSVGSEDERPNEFSAFPIAKENTTSQKPRKARSAASSMSGSDNPPSRKQSGVRPHAGKKLKLDRPPTKSTTEKKGSFRNPLKKGTGTTLSNLWTKDVAHEATTQSKSTQQRPPWGAPTAASAAKSQHPVPQRNSSIIPARDVPQAPPRGNPNYFSSRDLGLMQGSDILRSPSRTSYYSIHERRRDSVVSQTDTYSIHSAETRPGSPTLFKTNLKAQSSLLIARSEKNNIKQPSSSERTHRRNKSHASSIYTLKANNSATSLVLASQPGRSLFADSEILESLMRTGHVAGIFPQHHIVRNITRFVRFASASYGASFLRVMGIATSSSSTTKEIDTTHHHEHHSFSNHTQLPADTILLSSFVDPEGGTDSTGRTGTGVPMVHFVSLDHDSRAVVLTCRGTLGFEDVLTDMTCDYDELIYRGKAYKVHMGIYASARRLLSSRVLATIKAALEEFPDYGLVLCGHSLGGGVTALLAIMISEPSPTGTSFLTTSYEESRLPLAACEPQSSTASELLRLPSGRPIHVYAYGPPATISPSLRLATRGLVTTIVNGQDLVPHLSLGTLHDLQAAALAFKTDDSGAKGEVRRRVWEGLRGKFQDKWYQNGVGGTTQKGDDDQWAYSTLKALRASMLSAKLLPPGEVFVVESMPVLRRDAFAKDSEENKIAAAGGGGLGRPATRSILRYVRDVERRFSELRFGGSMLLDHSPGRYEASLGALGRGVLGS
jgi:hypothetical protein